MSPFLFNFFLMGSVLCFSGGLLSSLTQSNCHEKEVDEKSFDREGLGDIEKPPTSASGHPSLRLGYSKS